MADHTRSICLTTVPTLPRTSIPSSEHSHVDLSLKELKYLSRRLAAVALPFSQERQVLERIYYKGKNQHRSSLFWRKVVEVRRLAARINELDLYGVLETLRTSFHTVQGNNSKSLRGAWTHAPDLTTCKMILKRVQSACFLIDRARAQFRVAYQSFTVQLRTATFLPLMVSLVAITSRLDFLLAEVRSTIPSQWEAIVRVVTVIDPTSNLENDRSIQLPSLPVTLRPSEGKDMSDRPRKRLKLSNGTIEDLGSKINRQIEANVAISAREQILSAEVLVPEYPTCNPSAAAESVDQIRHAVPVELPDSKITPSTPILSNHSVTITPLSNNSSSLLAPPIPIDYQNSSNDPQAQHTAESFADVKKMKKSKTKKKKKRDEIDEIFGF